ncbi:MAG: hypothetical protein R3Y43_04515 [Alphaproteobacteria bacterium]
MNNAPLSTVYIFWLIFLFLVLLIFIIGWIAKKNSITVGTVDANPDDDDEEI